MEIITYIMLAFAAIAAIDRIAGCRLGLGEQFERGVMMLGPLTVSMTGMLVLAPVIADLIGGAAAIFPDSLDFSIVPASLLANDMGGAPLAVKLAADAKMGAYNGLVVSSMMGCTVSFTLPYVLGVTDKSQHGSIIFGILAGIVTIPIGCFAAGIAARMPMGALIIDLIPLVIFGGLVAVGILFFERITIRIFSVLGWLIKAVITVGLVVGITEFLTGFALIPGIEPFDQAMKTIIHIDCIMMGAFPLLFIVGKLLNGLLKALGGKLGINEAAALGLFSTLGTSAVTFAAMKDMDERGVVLNAAFSVSAAFVFVDHLAFTLSFGPEWVPYMILGKLVSGVAAVVLALVLVQRKSRRI